MKRALAFSLILALLSSALFWMCPLVLASPTLTVASGAGGSVIVQSHAINDGEPITIASGQEQSFSVPYSQSVSLTATGFAAGLCLKGWDGPFWNWPAGGPGTYDNPVTITVDQTARVTCVFGIIGTSNDVEVRLQTPRNGTYNQKTVPVAFEVASPDPDWYSIRVYDIRLYLDGGQVSGELSSVKVGSGEAYRYNSTVSVLAEGRHSFYVAAAAAFEAVRPILVGPSSPSAGSGVSVMGYFVVDGTPPSVSVLSPQDGGFEGLDASLDFRVDEAASRLAYCLDGVVNVTVGGNTTLRYGLSAGEHSVVVYAWDEAGNVGVSAPVTFTVTAFPTALVIAAIVVAALVSFGLVAYFLSPKRKSNATW